MKDMYGMDRRLKAYPAGGMDGLMQSADIDDLGPKQSLYLGGRGAPLRGEAPYGKPAQAAQRGMMSISYSAPDGTVYNVSASFDPSRRNSVVDGLMRCAYHLVMMGDQSYGSKGSYRSLPGKGGKSYPS